MKLQTVFFVLLLLQGGARAGDPIDEDDFQDLDLEKLLDTVITASKHEQDIVESPSAITVITSEQIENTHCTDVVCLLRSVPGLDVLYIKPMYATVGSRAYTDFFEQRAQVLIDGREINDEVFGLVFWQALPVHIDEIERIEVIRGPGSALYGANAHSLVVSIFTRRLNDDHARVFAGAGERGRSSFHAMAGHVVGDWHFEAAGGGELADHWELAGTRGREVARFRLRAERRADTSTTTAQAGMVTASGSVYSFLGPSRMRNTTFAYAHASHKWDFLKARLSFDLMDTEIPLSRQGYPRESVRLGEIIMGWVPGVVPIFSTNLDFDLQTDWKPFAGNLLIAGSSYRWLSAHSDSTAPSSIYQHRVGVYLHDEQRLFEQLTLVGGARLDYNTITPLTFSPRLAVVWTPGRDHGLRLAFGQAFRKPSFLNTSVHVKDYEAEPAFPEFEEFFRDAISNPDLGNESITTLEAGYTGRFPDAGLVVGAELFYNRYRDTITFYLDMRTGAMGLPDLAHSTARYENKGREADSLGGTLSLTWRYRDVLRLSANYTFRHTTYTADPAILSVRGAGGAGDRISWEPAHLFNLSAHVVTKCGLHLGADLHANSGRNSYVSEGSAFDTRIMLHQDAHAFVSGFLAWRFVRQPGWIEAGVRAFNMFDQRFYDWPGPEPPATNNPGGEPLGRRVVLFVRGAI